MHKYSIAVHGGAGPDSDFIHANKRAYEEGLKAAAETGYKLLKEGHTALDAVEEAVKSLEDNPLFNAGRGSALNDKGKVEMDASIMDGSTHECGAVSLTGNAKNPITAAKFVMKKTSHVYMAGNSVVELANESLELMPDSYFITEHQVDEYLKSQTQAGEPLKKKIRGTVGAVACDSKGNIAAATSTGGTTGCAAGRIGDSCIIGAGCYADNATCAISATGDGEHIINRVIGHSVAMYMELKGCTVQQACDHIIHERNKDIKGDVGIIAVDTSGNIGIAYNSGRMHRAWKQGEKEVHVKIYK